MSTTAVGPQPTLGLEEYPKLWIDSACEVLGQIAGQPFQAKALAAGEVQAPKSPVYALFTLGPPLAGEQVIGVSKADALKLALLLMGDPSAKGATFDAENREAFAELCRQIGGTAALSLGARLQKEVETKLAGTDRPAWLGPATDSAYFHLSSSAIPAPMLLSIQLSGSSR